MTNSTCTPIRAPTHILERELRADHLADLLTCLADLMVETGQQRRVIEAMSAHARESVHAHESANAHESAHAHESARDGIRRLTELEDSLKHVALEAAAVHQLLQHERLI